MGERGQEERREKGKMISWFFKRLIKESRLVSKDKLILNKHVRSTPLALFKLFQFFTILWCLFHWCYSHRNAFRIWYGHPRCNHSQAVKSKSNMYWKIKHLLQDMQNSNSFSPLSCFFSTKPWFIEQKHMRHNSEISND